MPEMRHATHEAAERGSAQEAARREAIEAAYGKQPEPAPATYVQPVRKPIPSVKRVVSGQERSDLMRKNLASYLAVQKLRAFASRKAEAAAIKRWNAMTPEERRAEALSTMSKSRDSLSAAIREMTR